MGDPDIAAAVRELWLTHLVLSFTGQALALDEFESVALAFGPFGEDPYLRGLDDHPHVAEIRREADERTPIFAEAWHSDWSFLDPPPAMTVLLADELPPHGGDTLYADQHAALDALDPDLRRRIDGLIGIHSARRGYSPAGQYGDRDVGRSMRIVASDDAMACTRHPIVRRHPETGRPALFVSMGYTIGIEGMADDEAQDLLIALFRHQAQERFVHRVVWQPGMLTMWDNRSVIHRATGGYEGHRRVLRRITIAEREAADR